MSTIMRKADGGSKIRIEFEVFGHRRREPRNFLAVTPTITLRVGPREYLAYPS
jgi:hypothetical protein